MAYAALFFAGALFIAALPHLIAGVSGRRVHSPFHHILPSSVTNVLWAFVLLGGAWALAAYGGGIDAADATQLALLFTGALLMALMLASPIGRHGERE